jgi:hypothetical protein
VRKLLKIKDRIFAEERRSEDEVETKAMGVGQRKCGVAKRGDWIWVLRETWQKMAGRNRMSIVLYGISFERMVVSVPSVPFGRTKLTQKRRIREKLKPKK